MIIYFLIITAKRFVFGTGYKKTQFLKITMEEILERIETIGTIMTTNWTIHEIVDLVSGNTCRLYHQQYNHQNKCQANWNIVSIKK